MSVANQRRARYYRSKVIEALAGAVGATLSHPFVLIRSRMVAQYFGPDHVYTSSWQV